MKKLILTLVAFFTLAGSANAMNYEDARQQALFLTDKMAYELNLTDEQYEAAYEINLDYLMNINTYDDLYGSYWSQRNRDLEFILLSAQWNSYINSLYFYRPLYWDGGYWHFRIYARYPVRTYYFFGRPRFYFSYRGGHSWRVNGGRSWYRYNYRHAPRYGSRRSWGLRDGFNRGNYGRGVNYQNGNRSRGRSWGNLRRNSSPSSTRTTVNRNRSWGNGSYGRGNFGTSRSRSYTPRVNSRTFTPNRSYSAPQRNSSSFGGHGSSFGNRSYSAPQRSSSFGGTRSYSAPNRSGGGSFGGHGHFTGGRR